ncbi:tetratricopeptide repeat protein [Novosphingobium sp. 1949]|uniref:Tetratricopeptide repeat protein n=1 Tax=Novosphingobium organovorum TaxID=2930092 RepID=A0ABT0B9W6_9SPHN|nr:tetratricopeptide repeat protein [Novosphingobium organovorum]MCJ2181621.1 tetratricopeptide repeat protein [Novosphingobium organovorum]
MRLILPAAAVFLTLSGCGVDPAQQFTRAQESYARHEFTKAKLDLTDLLDKQPENDKARLLLVQSYLALGDGEAATSALKGFAPGKAPADAAQMLGDAALLRGLPDAALSAVATTTGPEAERVRALAYLAKEDPASARTAFETGLASGSPSAHLLADYARFLLQQGETVRARSLVDQALKREPDSIDALLMDGQTATAQGRLKQALEAYSRALQSYPGNIAALVGKAGVLGDLGRTKDMQKLLDSAAGVAAKTPSLVYLQARAAAARGDWQGTRRILQANEQIARDRDDAAILYAEALHRLGQDEQARAELAPVLIRSPASANARRLLATVQIRLSDGNDALATMAPLVKSSTASAADLRLYAQAAKAAGRPDAAALAAKARFPTPQSMGAAVSDANAALKAGNWANAAAIYQDILSATDGTSPLILNNLAYARSQLGDKQGALEPALKALRYAPDNASVMDTAAWLLYETGKDKARALTLLRKAAAAAPENTTIARHLRTVEAQAKPTDD